MWLSQREFVFRDYFELRLKCDHPHNSRPEKKQLILLFKIDERSELNSDFLE